ncbi:uncharacterized protein LOC123918255 isoform X2 [Trifolium pratense]|uniref:uncharacterized protein LOC123918255 isoform X2 n=1 Tax=Trifolium pratense TaxID=57577 RepID=UPI001E693BCD|nr:uncharacterized protein LOC123918255 isoform X2 [Trifolium pratense]
MSIPFFSFVLLDSLSGRKLFIFVSPRLSICHRRLLLEFVCLVSNLFWLYTRFLLPPLSFYLALSLFIIVSVLICFFFVFSPWPIGLISCAMPFREELLGDSRCYRLGAHLTTSSSCKQFSEQILRFCA